MRPDRRFRPVLLLAALLAVGVLLGCTRGGEEDGWEVTVYYTAVESFHDDDPVEVRGCPTIDCSNGDELLGSWPAGFVTAVQDEGTGRITTGEQAGRYLNWASSEGYWLDDAPRDAYGRPLEPMRSAAADGVGPGTRVQLVHCGRGPGGGPAPPAVCERLSSGDWEIRDKFTPGLGGDRHIDLYLGEENVADFTSSEMYTTLTDATLAFTPP